MLNEVILAGLAFLMGRGMSGPKKPKDVPWPGQPPQKAPPAPGTLTPQQKADVQRATDKFAAASRSKQERDADAMAAAMSDPSASHTPKA